MEAVTVVGGGCVGLRLARNIAREGLETTLIEEHSKIGEPIQCTGLVSASGAAKVDIPIEECIVNTIYGANIYSPDDTVVHLERKRPVAYVLDRGKLDWAIAKDAKKAGVKILTSTQLINIRNETLFVRREQRGEMLKSKLVLGADGPNSKVREIMQKKIDQSKLYQGVQVISKGVFEKNYVQLYFGDFAKNFFAWVVPENETTARIGLAGPLGINLKEKLREFALVKGLNLDVEKIQAGLIPIGEPLNGLTQNNLALVGDSAFQTKATTGGGIVLGSLSSDVLSKTVVNYLKGTANLTEYEKNLVGIKKELNMHWKIRRYLNSLSSDQMNGLFSKLNKLNIQSFLEERGDMDFPSKFLPKLVRNPRYLTLFPQFIKYIFS